MPIITLLTDYGITDSYVAEVKGSILTILPNATLVDISHDVSNYNISEGAFHMARAAPYFPNGTVHVGVVDPGVGSSRRAIIFQTSKAFFVAPDNGLAAPAAERFGVEKVYNITNMKLLPEKVSDVFDGRDVFGPTGALLAKGISPDVIGTEIHDYIRLPSYEPKLDGNIIEATIIHVDSFGNIVTNVTYEILSSLGVLKKGSFKVEVDGKSLLLPYARRFSAVPKGELLLLVAGGGYMEFAVNQGNAYEHLGLGIGEKVQFILL